MAAQRSQGENFSIGEWLVLPSLGRIERGARAVRITPQSMRVLECLADAGGRVVSRTELMDTAWPRMVVTPDALSQCIVELRKAFGDRARRPTVIETIPKRGIRLIPPVSRPAAPALDQAPARRFKAWTVLFALSMIAAVALVGRGWLVAQRPASPWVVALAGANFRALTGFIGAEEQAAISHDGKLVAYLSDRAGAWDVWVGTIGTASFRNVTNGSVPGLRNPDVRVLGFSPDDTNVEFWTKTTDGAGDIIDYYWTAPVVGGPVRRNTGPISELGWSADGRRLVFHPSAPGDPLFLASPDNPGSADEIYGASPGVHNHFPLLSRDGETVYFVQGRPPDATDLWRVATARGEPERLTFHDSRVLYPTLLDERTLLYLATDADGSGPWLHALDLERRESHRIDTGSSAYTSLAASADGRRIVVTAPERTATLWRAALTDGMEAAQATQIQIPTRRAASPRFGAGILVYRAPQAGADGLWAITEGEPNELWNSANGRVVAGPAFARDGTRLAFVVQREERGQLVVMNPDGSDARFLAAALDVRGSPTWSPDGRWIAIGVVRDGEPRLYKISVSSVDAVMPLGDKYALDPAWSPSGDFIVFSSADVAGTITLAAIQADGIPHALPPLSLSRGSRRIAFLGTDPNALVVLKGSGAHRKFWIVDLSSGEERMLTDVGAGDPIGDFDVSADGSEIVFDRTREESDIIVIDRKPER